MSFFLRFLLPGLMAGLLFLLLSEIVIHIRGEQVAKVRRIFAVLAELYLAGVFALTLSLDGAAPLADDKLNLIPFRYLFSDLQDLFGNLLLLLPLGVFLPLLFLRGRDWLVALKTGAALSLFIEFLQFVSAGTFDINDLLLNTLGTLFGVLLGRILLVNFPFLRENAGIFLAKNRRKKKKRDARGILSLTGIAALCALLSNLFIPIGQAETGDSLSELYASLSPPAAVVSAVTTDGVLSPSALLYDPETDEVLYQKNGESPLSPASTAKMIAALTVLDRFAPTDMITVGSEVKLIAEDSSTAGLLSGDKLTVRQLLYALLLPSGNDAAYVLAVHTGRILLGDPGAAYKAAISAFIKAENSKAIELGAIHSYFLCPDGYDTPGQYTTAHDLAVIADALMQSALLKEIVGTYQFSETIASGRTLSVTSTNKLLMSTGGYYLEQANGIKTGTSSGAGGCLVSGAMIQGKQYICVVMGGTDEARWLDSIELFGSLVK